MKIDKTKKTKKTNKLSKYYRVSAYSQGLEKIALKESTSIYPIIDNDLKINRLEGNKLEPIDSTKPTKTQKIEEIEPINEDDGFYA